MVSKRKLIIASKISWIDIISTDFFTHSTGLSIDELKKAIVQKIQIDVSSYKDKGLLSNTRQIGLMKQALESLKMVEQSIEDNMPEDFYSIDLMSAYTFLGYILGEEVEDDLVEEIFSKFCMGK